MTTVKNSRTAAAALGVAAISAVTLSMSGVASADTSTGSSYQADLVQLNNSGASGVIIVQLDGNQATVTQRVSGLAATLTGSPYPHLQQIYIDGQGKCPTAGSDTGQNGVVDTADGKLAYGAVGSTLSMTGDTTAAAATNVATAPTGSGWNYSRTITLDPQSLASIKAGTAVVVVRGLDPTTMSASAQAAKSAMDPALALTTTAPALCGTLTGSQVSTTPKASPNTGGGSTAGIEDGGLFAIGGGLLLAAAGFAFGVRRRYWQR